MMTNYKTSKLKSSSASYSSRKKAVSPPNLNLTEFFEKVDVTEEVQQQQLARVISYMATSKDQTLSEYPRGPDTGLHYPSIMGPLKNHKKRSQIIYMMSPEQFLNLATNMKVDLDSYAKVKTRISAGEEMDIPFMDINADTGQVTSHEGRHRMLAARSLGIKEVPVAIFYRDSHENYVNISGKPTFPLYDDTYKGPILKPSEFLPEMPMGWEKWDV
jgi:hypothetical protein